MVAAADRPGPAAAAAAAVGVEPDQHWVVLLHVAGAAVVDIGSGIETASGAAVPLAALLLHHGAVERHPAIHQLPQPNHVRPVHHLGLR